MPNFVLKNQVAMEVLEQRRGDHRSRVWVG